MRKRSLILNDIEGKPIEEANYADICFYDKEKDNKIIVETESFDASNFPLSRFTPIGIVAVPSSHTDEQRPRIVSLAEMNYNTPDSGSVTEYQNIYWGGREYEVTDLPTKDQFPYLSSLTENGTVKYNTEYCYLPSDNFSARTENPLNSLEYFYYSGSLYNFMCSPYKEDGSKEERYFESSNTGNVLADFDGKANTEKILAEDNSYSTDWQTAITISNSSSSQFIHTAARCCWRFHTDGTKQGDWYLPSEGELGYALARKGSINLAINTLNTKYNETLGIKFGTDTYWSSTQYSVIYAVSMNFSYGRVNKGHKVSNGYVRAFLNI